MYNHILYFTYWIINALALFIFNLIFPANIVLGNWKFSPLESAVYAGFWVTFFVWAFWDFAIAKKMKFDSLAVILGYFGAVNIFSFWIVSRFPQFAGFGVTSYLWILAVGLMALVIQRLAWGFIVKR